MNKSYEGLEERIRENVECFLIIVQDPNEENLLDSTQPKLEPMKGKKLRTKSIIKSVSCSFLKNYVLRAWSFKSKFSGEVPQEDGPGRKRERESAT
jgi:hypothetical protein